MAVAEQLHEVDERPPAWWPLVGVHAGLLLVAFSAAWTIQPEAWFSRGQWASFGLIGAATLVAGVVGLTGRTSCPAIRASLALAAATGLHMAYDPQLTTLPGFTSLAGGPVEAMTPSLAHLGVVIIGVFAAIHAAVGRRELLGSAPFGGGVVAAAVLLLVLGTVMWLGLRNIYELSAASGLALLIFRVVSFGVLMVSTLALSGARGMGGVAQIYMGAALLAAIARNLGGMS